MSEAIERVIVNKEDLEELADSVRTAKNETGSYQWDTLKTSAIEIIGAGSNKVLDTCTVQLLGKGPTTIFPNYPYCYSYTYLDDNGNIASAAVQGNTNPDVTLNNVICNSVVTVYWNEQETELLTGAIELATQAHYFNAYKITAPALDKAIIQNSNSFNGGSND